MRAITSPPTPSPPPTMPIPRRSSTLLLACWSPNFKVARAFSLAYLRLDPGDAECADEPQGDALAQPEKRQDSDDDDDHADDVDDAVHEMTFSRRLRIESRACRDSRDYHLPFRDAL